MLSLSRHAVTQPTSHDTFNFLHPSIRPTYRQSEQRNVTYFHVYVHGRGQFMTIIRQFMIWSSRNVLPDDRMHFSTVKR